MDMDAADSLIATSKGPKRPMPPRGRPSKYTPELADEICERLSQGEPLAQICRDAHMPDRTTVWHWQQGDQYLSQRIARAREEGFDAIAGQCLEIADDREGEPQRDRLRVDTRLKLLAKWDPKRYGERLSLEHDLSERLYDWLLDADGGQ